MTSRHRGPKCNRSWRSLVSFIRTWSKKIWSANHQQLSVPDLSQDVPFLYWTYYACQVPREMMRPVASTAQSILEHAIMLKCYLWVSLLWCKHYIFHHRVWYRVHSVLCVYLTFGHHPHPVSYLCAKFHFGRTLHCWARPRSKNCILDHSPSLFNAPGMESLALQNWPFLTHSKLIPKIPQKRIHKRLSTLAGRKTKKKNNPRAKHNLAATMAMN